MNVMIKGVLAYALLATLTSTIFAEWHESMDAGFFMFALLLLIFTLVTIATVLGVGAWAVANDDEN